MHNRTMLVQLLLLLPRKQPLKLLTQQRSFQKIRRNPPLPSIVAQQAQTSIVAIAAGSLLPYRQHRRRQQQQQKRPMFSHKVVQLQQLHQSVLQQQRLYYDHLLLIRAKALHKHLQRVRYLSRPPLHDHRHHALLLQLLPQQLQQQQLQQQQQQQQQQQRQYQQLRLTQRRNQQIHQIYKRVLKS